MIAKILITVLVVLAVGVTAVLAYAATKPDDFRYERSTVIAASAEAIFPYLNDFKLSQEWSPFEELDPDMERRMSEQTAGEGATYAWNGDSNAGEGKLTILESVPNERVTMDITFVRPMAGSSTVDYILTPQGDQTKMTWAMHGPQPYLAKLMSVFIDCEKMMTESFEKGFANLKREVEGKA
ncbi:Polyketide cyclase / dehydrase and lipid transport [Methyloligella halotolerans]|uniref:Polyketide cyclase / dehydrase and lipid transport n=1 Tax=Methyloligella halotolerans TaxID=1177755 RepID=A0A1E2RUT8_9HYPH|nr:SRPBCC family protein [Methyloligella halotolerans]ODA65994.1 Polyketide cyclase / dehydrase and lipid transport [Methyloligella halotolerans]